MRDITERELFEDFVVRHSPFHPALLARKNVRGEYVSETAQAYWETWQAACASAAKEQS